jgi:hypothetical protein
MKRYESDRNGTGYLKTQMQDDEGSPPQDPAHVPTLAATQTSVVTLLYSRSAEPQSAQTEWCQLENLPLKHLTKNKLYVIFSLSRTFWTFCRVS